MKIVVIGGTGLIGSKVVACLDEEEYEAGPASPDTGVNALTGEAVMPAPYRAASSFLREGAASPFTTSKGAQA